MSSLLLSVFAGRLLKMLVLEAHILQERTKGKPWVKMLLLAETH